MGHEVSVQDLAGRHRVARARPAETDLRGARGDDHSWRGLAGPYPHAADVERPRCEVNNYTKQTLFNVSMSPHLTFRESVAVQGQEKSRQQGKVTLERDWAFTIPKIDVAPGPPFVFYIWNCCLPRFVQIQLPSHAQTADGRKIAIGQAEANPLWG